MAEKMYVIRSKHSNKVMDVCQDVDKKGMLIIYNHYGGPNQGFYIRSDGVSTNIISKQTGKYLTVAGNSDKNGVPVFEEPHTGLDGQKFRIQEVNPGNYKNAESEVYIYTFCGKVLDCC